jgi:hypothetical protein
LPSFRYKYFQDLPSAVRSFANSPLVLCLTAALGLTLLLRIGTRQFGQVEWNDSKESISSALDFLRRKAEEWKIGASLVEISADHVREVINYVDHHLRHREGILRATFNGQELCLEIAYQGSDSPSYLRDLSWSPVGTLLFQFVQDGHHFIDLTGIGIADCSIQAGGLPFSQARSFTHSCSTFRC